MGTNDTATDAAPRCDPQTIKHYHVHVYYDPSTRAPAARLREQVAAAFPSATLGRWHDDPVGPHPQSMYQIAFPAEIVGLVLTVADAQPSWPDRSASPGDWERLRRPYRPRHLVRRNPSASARRSESRSDAIPSYLRCPSFPDTSASTTQVPRPRMRA